MNPRKPPVSVPGQEFNPSIASEVVIWALGVCTAAQAGNGPLT